MKLVSNCASGCLSVLGKKKVLLIKQNTNPRHRRGLVLGLDYYSDAPLTGVEPPMLPLSAPVPQPTKTEMLAIKSTIALIFLNEFFIIDIID